VKVVQKFEERRLSMEQPSVQILVVVAITQVRRLRTDEEKGSMGTAVVHG